MAEVRFWTAISRKVSASPVLIGAAATVLSARRSGDMVYGREKRPDCRITNRPRQMKDVYLPDRSTLVAWPAIHGSGMTRRDMIKREACRGDEWKGLFQVTRNEARPFSVKRAKRKLRYWNKFPDR